jgi:hypothetical protein
MDNVDIHVAVKVWLNGSAYETHLGGHELMQQGWREKKF